MARSGKGAPAAPGGNRDEELMVVVLKLKGSGDTLKRGFDTLNNAFQAMIAPPIQTGRKAVASNGTPKQLTEASAEEPEESDVLDAEYAEEAEQVEPASTKNGSPPRTRSSYKFLSDFALDVSGEHWQDFAARRSPKTEAEKYLIAAEWITKNAGLETFSANHVFSCFRAMKWNEMRDFTQPMRKMKATKSYFENPTRKAWKLTTLGMKATAAINNPPQ